MERTITYRENARKEVSTYSEDVVKKVMELSGVAKVDFSSTRRTIEDQARIMYENASTFSVSTVAELKKKRGWGYAKPGQAVEEVYFTNKGKPKQDVLQLMQNKIQELLNKGQRVSQHCADLATYCTYNVIDIPYSSVPDAKEETFESVLAGMSKTVKSSFDFDKKQGLEQVIELLIIEDKCWHIEIAQKAVTKTSSTPATDITPVVSFAFPVKLAGDSANDVTAERVNTFLDHTEKANNWGGWFPLGANTVWHGGVHLHVEQRSDVVAMAAGEVVAVKLAESKEQAIGYYGSHNFILLRHVITGEKLNTQFPAGTQGSSKFDDSAKKEFYSLYMHLKNERLNPTTNSKLNQIKWLPRTAVKAGTEEHIVKKGESLEQLATQWNTTVEKIRTVNPELKDHYGSAKGKSWYNPEDKVKRPVDGPIDLQFLDSLKSGDVVKVQGALVKAGDLLWTSGMYGSDGNSGGVLHWEVFSQENLFPSFTKAEDNDDNWNMDSKDIFKMVDPGRGGDGLFSNPLRNLDVRQMRIFYQNDPDAAKLREFSCKFISEWAVDVDKGIDDMKGIRGWIARKDRLEPYQWWSKATNKGVTLPSDANHWHYNPISFVQKLSTAHNTNFLFPLKTQVGSYKSFPGRFGDPRKNKNGEIVRKHAGCDLYALNGTEVIAVKDGVVVGDLTDFYESTFELQIDHRDFIVRYGELDNKRAEGIKVGAQVKQGQVIGYIKKVANYHQPMLHLEMYSKNAIGKLTDKSNKPYQRRSDLIDPTPYLDGATQSSASTPVASATSANKKETIPTVPKTGEPATTTSEAPVKQGTINTSNHEFNQLVATVYGEAATESKASWRAIGHVVMNRVGRREWKKYKTVSAVLKNSGFDAYGQNMYSDAMKALGGDKSKKVDWKKLNEMREVLTPVYNRTDQDNTSNAVLYYSPKAQKALHKKFPDKYKSETPCWVNDKTEEVKVSGCENDDFAFYRYRKGK